MAPFEIAGGQPLPRPIAAFPRLGRRPAGLCRPRDRPLPAPERPPQAPGVRWPGHVAHRGDLRQERGTEPRAAHPSPPTLSSRKRPVTTACPTLDRALTWPSLRIPTPELLQPRGQDRPSLPGGRALPATAPWGSCSASFRPRDTVSPAEALTLRRRRHGDLQRADRHGQELS